MSKQLENMLRGYVGEEVTSLSEEDIEDERKPKSFWKIWENFESEMLKMIKEIGHFPRNQDLRKNGRSIINNSAHKYYGGILAVRKRMGYDEPKEKKPDYWKNWSNLESELQSVISDLGHFPCARELQEKKLSGLITGMFSYHGGLNNVRKKMGYDTVFDKKYSTKKGLEKGLEEIWKKFPEQEGNIPPDNWMRKNGFSNLGASIVRYHGGFLKLRKKFNFEELQRYRGIKLDSWKKLSNAIDLMFRENPEFEGKLPSDPWMRDNGHHGLAKAIRIHHGGFRKVRDKLGQEQLREEDGLFKDFDFVKNKLENIVKDHPEFKGRIPSVNWLQKNGYGSLYSAIYNYHGGYQKVRKKLGVALLVKEDGYWENWNNLTKELDLMWGKHPEKKGELPGSWWLRKNGYSSLGQAIIVYHGGSPKVREMLKLGGGCKPMGYWQIWENFERELGEVIKELGHFPKQRELNELHKGGLTNAIKHYYGGFDKVRERFSLGDNSGELVESFLERYVGVKDE